MSSIRRGVYWTCQKRKTYSKAQCEEMDISPHAVTPTPHGGISRFACKSPQALLRRIRRFGEWQPSDFDHSSEKIARVEVLPDGFIFTTFDTFKEACEAHERDQA
jgi:hypothetical protein